MACLIRIENDELVMCLAQANAPAELERGDAVEALRDALIESVRVHLVSDVPLGAFLSGGIDASAIVALGL